MSMEIAEAYNKHKEVRYLMHLLFKMLNIFLIMYMVFQATIVKNKIINYYF